MPPKTAVSLVPAAIPATSRQEALATVYRLALLGLADAEIGAYFGVSEAIFNSWKKRTPEITTYLSQGRVESDGKVALALYNRAIGGVKTTTKTVTDSEGSITVTETREDVAPDTAAATFWLKNRREVSWRDKQQIEHDVKLTWADLVTKSYEDPELVDITPVDNSTDLDSIADSLELDPFQPISKDWDKK
jgi:hypothetical protein